MSSVILMPKLGLTMENGRVIAWRKQEGDIVKKGEVLLEVETDKIVNEVESPHSGTLLKILVEEGSEVPVQTVLAVLGQQGEDISELIEEASKSVAPMEPEQTKQPESISSEAEHREMPTISEGQTKKRISPRAKKLLAQHGLLPDVMEGIEKSRITEADVRAFLVAKRSGIEPGDIPVKAAEALKPLSRIQRVVAERMTISFRDIPQFSLRFEVELDHLLGMLPHFFTTEGRKITVNDLILRAVAIALSRFPGVQNQYREKGIMKPTEINIGLAVALEDGLLVPVIHNAGRKRIGDISTESAILVTKAKEGKLNPNEISGGTITVSNLGMFDITSFTPIVNPGEGAILGVGALRRVPRIGKKDVAIISNVIELTLVCDHRSVNGVAGAHFCQELKKIMEIEEEGSW